MDKMKTRTKTETKKDRRIHAEQEKMERQERTSGLPPMWFAGCQYDGRTTSFPVSPSSGLREGSATATRMAATNCLTRVRHVSYIVARGSTRKTGETRNRKTCEIPEGGFSPRFPTLCTFFSSFRLPLFTISWTTNFSERRREKRNSLPRFLFFFFSSVSFVRRETKSGEKGEST